MADNINNTRIGKSFDVVQFIELPYEGIDDYVCVPHSWIQVVTAKGAVVAYPNEEHPSVTRDRVKNKEKYNKDWNFYLAAHKYTSNTYTDAEEWIMKTNKYGPLVEEDSNTSDTQPEFPLNRKLHSVNRNHSSNINDNPRKPLPRKLFKRPASSSLNKQLNGKQMKLSDAAQSPSAVVTDGKTKSNPRFLLSKKLHSVNRNHSLKFNNNSRKPLSIKSLRRLAPLSLKKQLDANQMKLSNAAQSSSAVVTDDKIQSNREQLINNQSMECDQTDEAAAVSIGNESTKPRTPLSLKKQLDANQMKLSNAAQSSSAVVTDDKIQSNREQLINNQSMECDQTDEAAAVSIGNESTKPRTPTQRDEQNIQALKPVIDVNELSEVNNIDEENDSQGIKKADKNKSQCHLISITMALLMTANEPSTSAKQITQQIQYNNQEHMSATAQLSNLVVTDGKTESNRERLTIQINQSMECAQTDEAAAASIGNESTKRRTPTQRAEPNIQTLSLPVIDVSEPAEVIVIDAENYSQGIKKPDKKNSQNHLFSNTMAISVTPKEPPASTKQTTQPNQYNNKENILYSTSSWNFKPRIENVQSVANVHIEHDHLIHEIANDTQSTSDDDDTLSLVKKSAQLNNDINGVPRLVSNQTSLENKMLYNKILNIKRDLALAAKNRQSNLMAHTVFSSVRSAEEQLSIVSQNHLQDGLPVRETQTGNSKEQIVPLGSSASSFEKTQHFLQTNAKPHNMTFVDPRNVRESKENNKYDLRPNSPIIRKEIPSTGQNTINPCNSLYPTSELPHERQLQLNQQELQRQLHMLKGEQRCTSNITTQGRIPMASHQNAYQPTYQNMMYNHHHNSPTLPERIPSTELNTTNPYNSLYRVQLVQQQQFQLHQRSLQPPPQTLEEQRYTSNIATQGKNQMAFHQNQYQTTYENNFQRDLIREYKECNKYDHLPNSTTTRKSIPSSGPNSTNPYNPLYQNSDLPHQRQFQLHPQYLQPPPQILNDKQQYTRNTATQGRRKKYKNNNKYEHQPNFPYPGPDSINHGVNSVSNAVTNNIGISDHAPIETKNNFYCNTTASGSRCVDKPIASQNSTFPNCQTHPEVVLEQQMLNNIATFYSKMSYTLHSTRDMYNNLQTSIHNTVKLYEQLLGEFKEFNTAEYSSNASPASNLTPNVSQSPVERHIQVPPRANSSYNNQHINNVSFVLPP